MGRNLRISFYLGASFLAGVLAAKSTHDYWNNSSHYDARQQISNDDYSVTIRNAPSNSVLGKIGAAGVGVCATGGLLTLLILTESFSELEKKNK